MMLSPFSTNNSGASSTIPFEKRATVDPIRLVKAAVARHPLPQGGEGGDFTLDRPSICTVCVVSNVETPVHGFHPWLMTFGPCGAAKLRRL